MQHRAEQFDVGVVVGRFQVHELHDGHKELIDHVCSQHNKVIIFLGLSHVNMSINNPLDFESRRQMIAADYPDINVLYIKDMPSDEAWSNKLDGMIANGLEPIRLELDGDRFARLEADVLLADTPAVDPQFDQLAVLLLTTEVAHLASELDAA